MFDYQKHSRGPRDKYIRNDQILEVTIKISDSIKRKRDLQRKIRNENSKRNKKQIQLWCCFRQKEGKVHGKNRDHTHSWGFTNGTNSRNLKTKTKEPRKYDPISNPKNWIKQHFSKGNTHSWGFTNGQNLKSKTKESRKYEPISSPKIESNNTKNTKNKLFFVLSTLAMVGASGDINNTLEAFLDLKVSPTPLQNLLELLEPNPRKFLLLGLHVLLIFLAKLHLPHPPPLIIYNAERSLPVQMLCW